MQTVPLQAPLSDRVMAAVAALGQGHFERAAGLAEAETRQDPRSVEAWLALCAALGGMGSIDHERAIADALAHIPPSDPARLVLEADRALALSRQARANEAFEIVSRIETDPGLQPEQRDMVGAVFAKIGLFERALPHCQAAAAALPNHPPALYNLATALRYLGRLDEAEAVFEQLLALQPDHSLGHASLAALRRWSATRNHISRLRNLAQGTAGENASEARARIHYALFKELGDTGDHANAWRELAIGAGLASGLFPFERERKRAHVGKIIDTFNAARLNGPAKGDVSAPCPIFIVGLPRSGTTLTERILAAHSQVTPMGETLAFTVAMREALGMSRKPDFDLSRVNSSADVDWSAVAGSYQRETRYLARGTPYVTEKLPHNYETLGQIHLAFPNSPLIHVRRGPMDSLFGAFKLLFAEQSFTWSYTLSDLAENYRLYRRLMDHWRSALDGRLHEITLETLIDNPEQEIRRLLEACGLPFEADCLSPHEAEGGVSTASSSQIRSPINRQGIGAWRPYASQLEPLRAELERDGFVDANGDPIW